MKKKPAPVQLGKAFTIHEVIAQAREKQRLEAERVAAMSPAERAEYDKEEAKLALEREEILKQLRGPGFMELKI